MLDDCGQSFHPPVSLDQQPPQLADGLVPLLRLLFALTGFSRTCSVRRHCGGWAALGCILQTGPRPGTGSWPSSRLGPGARASAGAGVGGCGVSRGRRWDRSLWCFSWCLWYLVRTSGPQVYCKTCSYKCLRNKVLIHPLSVWKIRQLKVFYLQTLIF